MFYRQKVLLALIEVYGGKLTNTDLEKLLFFFCQTTRQNHYDFFPYKYGAFSFISYYDKHNLIERGLLKDVEHFELNTSTSFLSQLKSKERIALRGFPYTRAKVRGRELVRKIYLEYPEYTIRSKIAKEILSQDEYKKVSSSWDLETDSVLFTIGYEGISVDEYLRRLISNNVSALIDVRKNPFSRKHGFSKNHLQAYTAKAGIKYFHLPELGIPSGLRKDLDDDASYVNLFKYYSTNILPYQQQAIDEIKDLIAKYRRVALTCFEADYRMCHRHKVAELFELDSEINIPVRHIEDCPSKCIYH
ncbi:MAG: DUF488 domain-containing protein [Sedimentisphaerales bacterium]|nr:DUF488 domain-containing protein [Sedimentisphaerales bacterium]